MQRHMHAALGHGASREEVIEVLGMANRSGMRAMRCGANVLGELIGERNADALVGFGVVDEEGLEGVQDGIGENGKDGDRKREWQKKMNDTLSEEQWVLRRRYEDETGVEWTEELERLLRVDTEWFAATTGLADAVQEDDHDADKMEIEKNGREVVGKENAGDELNGANRAIGVKKEVEKAEAETASSAGFEPKVSKHPKPHKAGCGTPANPPTDAGPHRYCYRSCDYTPKPRRTEGSHAARAGLRRYTRRDRTSAAAGRCVWPKSDGCRTGDPGERDGEDEE